MMDKNKKIGDESVETSIFNFERLTAPNLSLLVEEATGKLPQEISDEVLEKVKLFLPPEIANSIIEIGDIREQFCDRIDEVIKADEKAEILRVINDVMEMIDKNDFLTILRQWYSQGRYSKLKQFIPFLGYKLTEDVKPHTPLFHGIQMLKAGEVIQGKQCDLLEPDDIAERVLAIRDKGLRASNNLENIPGLPTIFCVRRIRDTYGLVGVVFKPGESPVASITGSQETSEGLQVFARQKKPLLVFIKGVNYFHYYQNAENLASKDVFANLTLDQYLDYVEKLKQALDKRGVKYLVHNPLMSEFEK